MDRLNMALAEQLKVPFLQIARLSEYPNVATLEQIRIISEQSLRLLEGFIESSAQEELPLEPVVPGSIIYDTANLLEPLAHQHGFKLTIDLTGKNKPVMANKRSLKTILSLLGASLIEAGVEEEEPKKIIVLGSHASARGSVVGVFSGSFEISQNVLHMMRLLLGKSNQSMPVLGVAGGAALAVADKLCERMGTSLKSYKHQSLKGVGSLLVPSHQLELIM